MLPWTAVEIPPRLYHPTVTQTTSRKVQWFVAWNLTQLQCLFMIKTDNEVYLICPSFIESAASSSAVSLTGAPEDTHVTPEYVPGCFEGPEKTMEVVFKPNMGPDDGLRSLSREQLDFLCTQAKCTILSSISNTYIDAYVLSESSLFIYKSRFIMKTCGTTTLLRCLSSLLQFADALGMELTWVGYSRKNLLFPSAQVTI